MNIDSMLISNYDVLDDVYVSRNTKISKSQDNTNNAFGDKWTKAHDEELYSDEYTKFQEEWYLKLYGFETEEHLKKFLRSKKIILDAGCGYGDKTAWFARLSPETKVVGVDYSDAVFAAQSRHSGLPNLTFVKGDIGSVDFKKEIFDYISCDQVLQHTDNPPETFKHLCSLLKKGNEFSCFVYAKKALPRELIDEYFREKCTTHTKEELWELSEQLTELGKRLSDLNIEIDVPEIPLLGIKGGKQDLQRFIYWDFLKCFWNKDHGYKSSVATNYDWYSPQNAYRYTEEEFREMISDNNLDIEYFYNEPNCYSGRFVKK